MAIVGKVMLDLSPLIWMREKLLTNQAVKSGRSIGRQAHIKATAASAVLHSMSEIPATTRIHQYKVITEWVGQMLLTISRIYDNDCSSYAYENTTSMRQSYGVAT